MRSRANTLRVALERVLRALTLVVLALAAWEARRPAPEQASGTARDAELRESLGRWTATPPTAVRVSLAAAPRGEERDWLRALRRAGTPVTWHDDAIPALAVEVAAVAGPRGGRKIWVVAPAGSRAAVADAIAPIDTLIVRAGGAMVIAPATTGPLTVSVGSQRAEGAVRDSIFPRRVLVLAQATWEAKFIITALEEAGWPVDARLVVAPGVEIVQGPRGPPDTARHVAVVVLDAPTASRASAVARYVRSGGGAILIGTSASAPSMASVAAGRVGRRARPASVAFAEDVPRRALGFRAIVPRDDAIVLEERDGQVTAAARRVEAGRVIQLGYEDTWRWRLGGGSQALGAHRAWWSELVSSVAYRPVVPLASPASEDDAPLARLVDALGMSSEGTGSTEDDPRWSPSAVLLFALICGLLLAELASRRLRGAP